MTEINGKSLGHQTAVSPAIKFITISVGVLVICGVWAYARFGYETSLLAVIQKKKISNRSPASMILIASPGLNYQNIHIRSGPGLEYRILEKAPRGTELTVIGSIKDSSGDRWGVLANNRGYVKLSVLSLPTGSTK